MMYDEKEKLFGDKKIPLKVMIKRTFKYLKGSIWRFVIAFLLVLFNVAIDIAIPIFTGKMTDALQGDAINIQLIVIIVVMTLVLSIISQIFIYIESMILQKTGQKIVYDLRLEVFEHIERMSLNQLVVMPVGSLVTRVATYTTNMSDLFTDVLVRFVKNAMLILAVFIAMIVINPLLSLVILGIGIVVFIISFFFNRTISKAFKAERKGYSDLNAFLNENLSGMKTIQSYNQEENKLAEFDVPNEFLRKSRYRVIFTFAMFRPLINFLSYVAIALIFLVGIHTHLSPGSIVAFYLLISKFFSPIEHIIDQLNQIQKAFSSSERLFNLLDVQPEVIDKEDALDIKEFKGKIEFRNVYFAYDNKKWILKNVSFVVNPKETLALVGATGSGKTTILSLITRNYEIQRGQILIDDIDIRNIKIESLRRAVGQMLQDVFLFKGTIKDNITLFDDSFSDERIEEVSNYVNASYFIDKLPNKFESEVIERGENFSQGQRQLISFARTTIANPQILILDEATSNIDTETEVVIQESLKKMRSIGTMIVVAHRLSTIQHADKIIVLSHGEILEEGTHQSLLKKKGNYYRLYRLQFDNL